MVHYLCYGHTSTTAFKKILAPISSDSSVPLLPALWTCPIPPPPPPPPPIAMAETELSSSGSGGNKRARVEAKESLANGQGKKTLTFSSGFGGHDVRLIEISEDMAKCIERGEALSIIGSNDTSKGGSTDAVLCSQNKTFTIKKVETSNSVLIVPPSNENTYQIHSLSQYYYELKPTPARTERIVELLRRTGTLKVSSQ